MISCRDILRRGGTAVDGAIAALLCTSVMNPQSMGIGGGSIFTVMDSSGNCQLSHRATCCTGELQASRLFVFLKGKVKIINSRETVPKNVKSNLLQSCPKTFQLISGTLPVGSTFLIPLRAALLVFLVLFCYLNIIFKGHRVTAGLKCTRINKHFSIWRRLFTTEVDRFTPRAPPSLLSWTYKCLLWASGCKHTGGPRPPS